MSASVGHIERKTQSRIVELFSRWRETPNLAQAFSGQFLLYLKSSV